MACQYFAPTAHGSEAFTVAMPKLTFGRGCLKEIGQRAFALGLKRVALFTDPHLLDGPLIASSRDCLKTAGIETAIFSDIRIEPCSDTVENAARFLANNPVDGMISIGGGSVMDTAKAALLLHHHGGTIIDYIAAPIGNSKQITGPLMPHIACPTTSGTGSECTSISVLRINSLDTKFVIASPCLLPTEALVDPQCCDSLPANVIASTGFDLCCHALECFTARAYTQHARVSDTRARQLIQGANPFSDLAAREALEIAGKYLVRGVADAADHEARDNLMWAATLAGIAFGNSGTHLPHAMSYGVTHLMKDITTDGYDVASPFVPHGISVIVNAPAIFQYTADGAPQRHLEAAILTGADVADATIDEAGEVLAKRLIEMMRQTGMPNGLRGVGFTEAHISALAKSSSRQKRAITNAPRDTNLVDLENMYRGALAYW
ncbi:MAG: hydroxyacid-oxoacid transhydrogenase [Granulosicoccus sp.]